MDIPDDLSENSLKMLVALMLAQAQECFWQKAVLGECLLEQSKLMKQDGLKDAVIARLAAHVAELYEAACEIASHNVIFPAVKRVRKPALNTDRQGLDSSSQCKAIPFSIRITISHGLGLACCL